MNNNILTFLLSLLFLAAISACSSTKEVNSTNHPFDKTTYQIFQNGTFVDAELDQKPEAIAGEKEFLMTMYRKINYPAQGREKGIQGMVKVEVIVNEMGKLEDSKIAKSLGQDFDDEALAAIRRGFELPFQAAMQNGKPVKVKYQIPVRFKLHG
ncbi:MAG: energy transducer TonB [Saprospiraceae bacterium]